MSLYTPCTNWRPGWDLWYSAALTKIMILNIQEGLFKLPCSKKNMEQILFYEMGREGVDKLEIMLRHVKDTCRKNSHNLIWYHDMTPQTRACTFLSHLGDENTGRDGGGEYRPRY